MAALACAPANPAAGHPNAETTRASWLAAAHRTVPEADKFLCVGQNAKRVLEAASFKGRQGFRIDVVVDSTAPLGVDRKSTRLNSSHVAISYAVFCLKKKTHLPQQSTSSRRRRTPRT